MRALSRLASAGVARSSRTPEQRASFFPASDATASCPPGKGSTGGGAGTGERNAQADRHQAGFATAEERAQTRAHGQDWSCSSQAPSRFWSECSRRSEHRRLAHSQQKREALSVFPRGFAFSLGRAAAPAAFIFPAGNAIPGWGACSPSTSLKGVHAMQASHPDRVVCLLLGGAGRRRPPSGFATVLRPIARRIRRAFAGLAF